MNINDNEPVLDLIHDDIIILKDNQLASTRSIQTNINQEEIKLLPGKYFIMSRKHRKKRR